MRKLIIILLAIIPFIGFAQEQKVNTEVTLTTRNVWRGVDFGNSTPTAEFLLTYDINDYIEVGSFISSSPLTNIGYGNTINFFAGVKKGNFALHIDDYYFNGDVTNIPTEFTSWEKSHFLEARASYSSKLVSGLVGYSLYTGELYKTPNNQQGVYIEGSLNVINNDAEQLILTCGGITGPSALNFHDKSGITNVSAKYGKTYGKYNIWTQVIYNPNHAFISPAGLPRIGYGNNKLNFVIAITRLN